MSTKENKNKRVIELDFLIPLYFKYAATRTSKLCIRCGHITSQGSDILKKLRNYNFQMRGNHPSNNIQWCRNDLESGWEKAVN